MCPQKEEEGSDDMLHVIKQSELREYLFYFYMITFFGINTFRIFNTVLGLRRMA
jgi:hypothetical protein